jgi:hypothetical protein
LFFLFFLAKFFKLHNDSSFRKILLLRSSSLSAAATSRQNAAAAAGIDEETEKNDAKILYNIRLVIGGLMLPTIATTIDSLLFSRLGLIKSVLARTILAGLSYTFVKGAFKIIYKQKIIWQQTHRDILDYQPPLPATTSTPNVNNNNDDFKFH